MAYREIGMVEVKEVLRLWLKGHGFRAISRLTPADRKTVRRYVEVAEDEGLCREADESQLTDELLGRVAVRIKPGAPSAKGEKRKACERHRKFIESKLAEGLRLTKVRKLLQREKREDIPYRTLHRFASEELGFGRPPVTVRVDDPEPGSELQVDFGRMGLIFDPVSSRRRVVWALIFTACYSRHSFVWLTYEQTLESVIDGCEAAWRGFGGVFGVLIPDNLKAIVDKSDPLSPRLNERFVEYAQARGFIVDPARVRKPKDKPRVERTVPYVRQDFFAGETFLGLDDAQARVVKWSRDEAGMRRHGTTRRRPLEVFLAEEQPCLAPPPEAPYDIPLVAEVLVHNDHHIRIGEALYSLPTEFVGKRVTARADRQLVRIYDKRRLIKTHPRQEQGGRATDPSDYPSEVRAYATRDSASLIAKAHEADEVVGFYAEQLLEHPRPWSQMRHLYRLLGLLSRYGVSRVASACGAAADLEVFDVARIERMLERALESQAADLRPSHEGEAAEPRFARSPDAFRLQSKKNS